MLQLAAGIIRTVEAIKTIDPDAIMVHVEATGLSRAASEDLQALVAEEQQRGFLCYDLITGRVTRDHPLFTWLVRSGAHAEALAAIARSPIQLDIAGLNFYPQWSTKQISFDSKGRRISRPIEKDGAGFETLLADYYQRYGVPIMITETSAIGTHDVRSRWLAASVAAIKRLRGQGVPVLGYTWFPLFTMIDWRYRFGNAPLETYRLELGMYVLDESLPGRRWRATPLVEQWRAYVADPVETVGPLVYERHVS
jgi:beta-glucosidase/6-phospho-beta-glucosidase/beta-galactosidase